MQAHPHSESRLNAGTIAAACCYVCQHIDLSRAIEALMLMLTVLRIRVVVEVENKSRCCRHRRRREPPQPLILPRHSYICVIISRTLSTEW